MTSPRTTEEMAMYHRMKEEKEGRCFYIILLAAENRGQSDNLHTKNSVYNYLLFLSCRFRARAIGLGYSARVSTMYT